MSLDESQPMMKAEQEASASSPSKTKEAITMEPSNNTVSVETDAENVTPGIAPQRNSHEMATTAKPQELQEHLEKENPFSDVHQSTDHELLGAAQGLSLKSTDAATQTVSEEDFQYARGRQRSEAPTNPTQKSTGLQGSSQAPPRQVKFSPVQSSSAQPPHETRNASRNTNIAARPTHTSQRRSQSRGRRFLAKLRRGTSSEGPAVPPRLLEICKAAQIGDSPRLEAHIQNLPANFDINNTARLEGVAVAKSPMMYAASAGYVRGLQLLSAVGGRYDQADSRGDTVLHHALETSKCAPCLAWLLNQDERRLGATTGADARWRLVEASNNDGEQPIHFAAQLSDADALSRLVNAGASHAARDKLGRTPLHCAVVAQRLENVQLLCSLGADLNAADEMGETPLHLAARVNGQNSVKSLLNAGADRARTNKAGDAAIHSAARHGHLTVLEMLILGSEDLERRNSCGETILHLAAGYDRPRVVRALLRSSAQVNEYSRRISTPVRPSLLEGRAQPAIVSRHLGGTALHYACFIGAYDCAHSLLAYGASVNANMEDGRSPLMLACEAVNVPLVQLLLNHGANVNAATADLRLTALHITARTDDLESAKLLISHGARRDVELVGSGDTPYGYGHRYYDRSKVLEMLLHCVAPTPYFQTQNSRPGDNMSPAMRRAYGGAFAPNARPAERNACDPSNGYQPMPRPLIRGADQRRSRGAFRSVGFIA